MSFSRQVREELIKHYSKQAHCQKAELAAILLFNSKGLAMDAESGKYIYSDPRSVDRNGFTENRKTFNINGVMDLGADLTKMLKRTDDKRAFLRGAFIASGTISDPNKDYHFEIAAPDEWTASLLVGLLADFDIKAKTVTNRGERHVVYVKDSEDISLALNVMEAGRAMMEFENIHIERELRGAVNRQMNCDTANINKAISAGAKQIRDIQLISDTIGLDELEEGLRNICIARLNNPDASLTELGEMMLPKVGKSGANHRMRKISQMAEEIRNRQK